MAISITVTVLNFIISLLVSTVIIYVVTKLFGEKKGIGTAILAALAGSLIYAAAYFFLGGGLLAAVIGGVVWLVAIGSLYEAGWLKAFGIAFVVWFLATVIGVFLPTLTGPL